MKYKNFRTVLLLLLIIGILCGCQTINRSLETVADSHESDISVEDKEPEDIDLYEESTEQSILLIIESKTDWASIYFPTTVEIISTSIFLISEDASSGIDPWGVYIGQDFEIAEQGNVARVGYYIVYRSEKKDAFDFTIEKGCMGEVAVSIGTASSIPGSSTPILQTMLWKGDRNGPHSYQSYSAIIPDMVGLANQYRPALSYELTTELDKIADRWCNIILDPSVEIDVFWPDARHQLWIDEKIYTENAVSALKQERQEREEQRNNPDRFDYDAIIFHEPIRLLLTSALLETEEPEILYLMTGDYMGNKFSNTFKFTQRDSEWKIDMVYFNPYID